MRSLKESLAKIDKVSVAEVLSLAKSLFLASQLNLAVIGPFKDKERFQKILKL